MECFALLFPVIPLSWIGISFSGIHAVQTSSNTNGSVILKVYPMDSKDVFAAHLLYSFNFNVMQFCRLSASLF